MICAFINYNYIILKGHLNMFIYIDNTLKISFLLKFKCFKLTLGQCFFFFLLTIKTFKNAMKKKNESGNFHLHIYLNKYIIIKFVCYTL